MAVIGEHFKALIARTVPLVEHLHHIVSWRVCIARCEALRPLFGFVPGVAFHLETNTHRTICRFPAPPVLGQFPPHGLGIIIEAGKRLEGNLRIGEDAL